MPVRAGPLWAAARARSAMNLLTDANLNDSINSVAGVEKLVVLGEGPHMEVGGLVLGRSIRISSRHLRKEGIGGTVLRSDRLQVQDSHCRQTS